MTRILRPLLTSAAVLALGLQPTLASAQGGCVSEAQISDMVVYAIPLAMQSLQNQCSPQLFPDGFLAREGMALSNAYLARQEAAWPGAKDALIAFAGDDPEARNLFNTLPREALQPFVDAIVVQKVAEEIKVEDCGKIERVIEALAPLEPQEAGKLVGVIMSLVEPKNPPICPLEDG